MFNQSLEDADIVSRFCRYQLVSKRNLPIRSSEMGLLVFVSNQDNPVTPLSISEFFNIAKPSVTELISRLIKLGYLAKENSLIDGRSYTIKLTSIGHNLVETALKDYLQSLEILKSGLGIDDYNGLISILNKANKILEMEKKQ